MSHLLHVIDLPLNFWTPHVSNLYDTATISTRRYRIYFTNLKQSVQSTTRIKYDSLNNIYIFMWSNGDYVAYNNVRDKWILKKR